MAVQHQPSPPPPPPPPPPPCDDLFLNGLRAGYPTVAPSSEIYAESSVNRPGQSALPTIQAAIVLMALRTI
ncbi:hypothetical protein M0804_008373 [Polistes exclamans]|nr:hypothetical protein M0804_008373 [Polistes exclamans]